MLIIFLLSGSGSGGITSGSSYPKISGSTSLELQKEISELDYPTGLQKPKVMIALSYSINSQSREAITERGKVRPKHRWFKDQ